MFGHAYNGQLGSRALLDRFKKGGGTLYDLEYLLDTNNRRIAAFGYWAGFAGAAVALKVWLHQKISKRPGPKEIKVYSGRKKLVKELKAEANGKTDMPVIINADAMTTHQSVVDVMEASRLVGLNRITFSTKVK